MLTTLQALGTGAFRAAHGRLHDLAHTAYLRTEQLSAAYTPVAFEEHVVRRDLPGTARIVRADSGGTFSFGFLGSFAAAPDPVAPAVDPAPFVLPEDPAYLSPRNREAFSYRFAPDTTLWNEPVQVIEVRARPNVGDAQAFRFVRLYVHRPTQELIGVTLERAEHMLLYREHSRFSVMLRLLPGDRWVPHTATYWAVLDVLFRPTQGFRSTHAYYGYGPA